MTKTATTPKSSLWKRRYMDILTIVKDEFGHMVGYSFMSDLSELDDQQMLAIVDWYNATADASTILHDVHGLQHGGRYFLPKIPELHK